MKTLRGKDYEIPTLGFGTFELEGENCMRMVEKALEVGYRHIDTAQIYKNEAEVGKAIQNSALERSDLWVTTKVWRDDLSKDSVLSTTAESLKNLQTNYVDLLLIHWPNEDYPLRETFEALHKLQENGQVRQIGISNFPVKWMKEALEYAPNLITNQVEYHPYLSQEDLLNDIKDFNNIFLTAYSPLGQAEVLDDPTLKELAEKHDKTVPQVILRWHLQQGIVAIPRSSNPDHVESNFKIWDFELSNDEMKKITSLQSKNKRIIDPSFAPEWDKK